MKTWQMIKELTENPKLKFKNNRGVTIIGKLELNKPYRFTFATDEAQLSISGVLHDDEWELVQEPVDFMAAANSGKRISNETWDGYYFLHEALHILQNCDNALGLINGKWLIEC